MRGGARTPEDKEDQDDIWRLSCCCHDITGTLPPPWPLHILPGRVENNSPQAYTGYEPAALRGGRTYAYDPYEQTFNRLRQLETIGHDTSKVDLIVMGGDVHGQA